MTPLLQDWVTREAALHPEASAIVCGPEKLTYGQLEKTSNQLARALEKFACHKGDRVCFLMPKSPLAIISMIGILKAGCIHVPLDPGSPPLRIRKILASCDTHCLLAAGPVLPLLQEIFDGPSLRDQVSVAWLEPRGISSRVFPVVCTGDDLAHLDSNPVPQKVSSADAAHILFTSGSTGVPKGVIITHSNVIHFVAWALRHFGIGRSERFSGHTPLHFDLSTFDVFGSLAAGAELHMVPHETTLSPFKLAEFIRAGELTQWFSVPSVLNYMAKFDAVKFGDFPSLRRVLWCGEVLPTPVLSYWMQRLPHVRFTNLYGPTEATIASSFYDVPACPLNERAPIPIGTACDGEELMVLDRDMQPVPQGVIGDLYIAGAGLSPGYWRDGEKTEAAFLHISRGSTNSRIYRTGDLARRGEDGLVYFIGRNDTQIKSRGYRIELGEIEAALSALSDLQESAVVAIDRSGFEGWLICCAYVLHSASAATSVIVRKELGKHIPSYMMPARWMNCGVLPKNPNGKIDRPKLRELFLQAENSQSSPTGSAPPVQTQNR